MLQRAAIKILQENVWGGPRHGARRTESALQMPATVIIVVATVSDRAGRLL